MKKLMLEITGRIAYLGIGVASAMIIMMQKVGQGIIPWPIIIQARKNHSNGDKSGF